MTDFRKFYGITYDNDVIKKSTGINMIVFPKDRQIIPVLLIPCKVDPSVHTAYNFEKMFTLDRS